MRKILSFILAASFTFTLGTLKANNLKTTITFDPSIYLSRVDCFDNFVLVNKMSKKTQSGELICENASQGLYYFVDEKTDKFKYFIALSGDNISIKRDENGIAVIQSTLYSKEFSFVEKLNKQDLHISLKYEGNEISYWEDYLKAYDNSKINTQLRLSLLASEKENLNPLFISYFQQIIYLKRLDFLVSPYNPCSPQPNFIPPLDSTIFLEEINEIVSTLNELKDIEAYSFWLAKIIPNYLNFISVNSKALSRAQDKFDFCINNFSGELLDVALTKVMLAEGTDAIFYLKNSARYFSACKNENYKNLILEGRNKMSIVEKDEELLSTLLQKPDGEKISWKELLINNAEIHTYYDFWATWCAGCKTNLKELDALDFSKLKVVFISIDSDSMKWKKGMEEWSFPENAEHYRLHPESKLAELLTKPSIPRGTLANDKGEIVSISLDLKTLVESLK